MEMYVQGHLLRVSASIYTCANVTGLKCIE